MKKLILIGSLFLSHAAFAGDGLKGAEIFLRLMVQGSAEMAAQAAGNQDRLENMLCSRIPRYIPVGGMAQKIAGPAWAKGSGAERNLFVKTFTKYLANMRLTIISLRGQR